MVETYAVPTGSRPRTDRLHRTLARVALSLDCTVDALLTGEGLPEELAQSYELISLWASLQSYAQRERVLHAAGQVAEQFRYNQ